MVFPSRRETPVVYETVWNGSIARQAVEATAQPVIAPRVSRVRPAPKFRALTIAEAAEVIVKLLPATVAEIREATGFTYGQASNALYRLRRQGRVCGSGCPRTYRREGA